jgi:hypothetical protein
LTVERLPAGSKGKNFSVLPPCKPVVHRPLPNRPAGNGLAGCAIVELLPGRAWSLPLSMDGYDLTGPGEYRLRAYFQPGVFCQRRKVEPKDEGLFSQPLVAPAVLFRVVESPGSLPPPQAPPSTPAPSP